MAHVFGDWFERGRTKGGRGRGHGSYPRLIGSGGEGEGAPAPLAPSVAPPHRPQSACGGAGEQGGGWGLAPGWAEHWPGAEGELADDWDSRDSNSRHSPTTWQYGPR